CAALTCDEAGACALATLLTVAPLDLRDISESVVLAEAGQAALDMLRKTADFQRAFREWEGTMICHVVDLADGDEHVSTPLHRPPHRLHLLLGEEGDVKRWSAGASYARACGSLCDKRRPAPLGDLLVGEAVKVCAICGR
ncbi:unnamed protein product, partial [Ectocarpus fasciculatus]